MEDVKVTNVLYVPAKREKLLKNSGKYTCMYSRIMVVQQTSTGKSTRKIGVDALQALILEQELQIGQKALIPQLRARNSQVNARFLRLLVTAKVSLFLGLRYATLRRNLIYCMSFSFPLCLLDNYAYVHICMQAYEDSNIIDNVA